jgi:hypothetical protein
VSHNPRGTPALSGRPASPPKECHLGIVEEKKRTRSDRGCPHSAAANPSLGADRTDPNVDSLFPSLNLRLAVTNVPSHVTENELTSSHQDSRRTN